MCGIVGLLSFDSRDSVDQQRLVAMRDTLYHRGPDGAGLMTAGRIGLAHRRLSIIDLVGGHQPMASNGAWVVSNGEIYNFRALRSQLESMGYVFTTQSDTEVILGAWEMFGENCVDHLDGMFAFAIWDTSLEKLFLARDRLGIKPLYYSIGENEFSFASEIKALLCQPTSAHAFSHKALPEYLANRYVAGADTFFDGIRKLLPGHSLSWSKEDGFRERRYWQPPVIPKDREEASRSDYTAQVAEGLEAAVRSHLVSDVPVGLFLSGGLDSSALAAIMAPMVDGPIQTFSVGFSETAANELHYARLMAEAIGAEHREITVTPDEFFAALPGLIWQEDEPIAFTSSIPLQKLSRLAAKHVKVVLTGEGADELFIGYDYRYRVTAMNRKLGGYYETAIPGSLRKRICTALQALPPSLSRYAERTFLTQGTAPRDIFFENFSVFRGPHRQRLLQDPADRMLDPHATGLEHYLAAGEDALQSMSHADLQTYLVELLMKQDQMSMSASIESRVPFLDHHLVELVSRIPSRFKMRGWQTKALLRDAVRDRIPSSILGRKKMGFPVPISEWLRGDFWPIVEEFVLSQRSIERGHFRPKAVRELAMEHKSGRKDHGERLWLLINLEMWRRIFTDGVDPARIYVDTHCEIKSDPKPVETLGTPSMGVIQ